VTSMAAVVYITLCTGFAHIWLFTATGTGVRDQNASILTFLSVARSY